MNGPAQPKRFIVGLVTDTTNNDLTYRIIGAAMEVHNQLGAGYKEEVYEKSLAAELEKRGITARRQAPVEVFYNEAPVGLFFLDILVDEQVVVEIKALAHQLTGDELAQVINYLKAGQYPVGLLINFGHRKLEFRRIFPPKDTSTPVQRVGRDNVRKSFLPDPPD